MKPGMALAQWLADQEAQALSYARVQDCARRWSVHPLLAGLQRGLVEAPERSPEFLLDTARHFMDRGAEIGGLMRELIALAHADPFFRPPFYALSSEAQDGLLLYHHPELSISLGVIGLDKLAAKKVGRTGGASINFTGYVTLLRFVEAGGATLSFWEAPEITDTFSAAEGGRCRLVDCRRLADGEEIVVDGRRHSFVIEHAERDILFFQAVVRAGAAPVGVEYDSDSLECIGASSTDEPSSRLQMMVSLLSALDRDDALPLFEEALASPYFYTRWHVMREMLALDAEAALPSLRRLAEQDPHPEVRAAARRTLELFFADAEPIEATACRA